MLTAVVFCVVGVLLSGDAVNEPVSRMPEDGAVFAVEGGESLSSIADRLDGDGLIRSPLFLKIVSYVRGTQRDFQAGTYRIEPDMSTTDIHDLLVSGREILERVTIPEGWTSSQISDRLASRGITPREDFLAAARDAGIVESYGITGGSVEGYLFPDTYLFPRDFPAERTVRVLVDRFFDKVEELLGEGDIPPSEELHRRVVVASIIEREYRAPEEADVMASVFYNRLERGMKLQSCATVAYVMTEELGMEYPEVLTYDDLEILSEYNTYRTAGLPPGPISNPGETALEAAFFPAESDYLYFVLRDPDAGRHVFTRSFDEHLSAKNFYLKKS